MRTLRIAIALVFALAAHAQTSRGTVTGTVLDQSGAVIRGARVDLTGVDTGAKLSTVSNDSGVYRFDAVDLGVYEIEVAHPGFRSFRGAGIKVEANRTTTFDPRLELGAAETIIQVSAESSEMLVKDSPLRGGNFGSREVRDLPLPLLNPISLARTLPGATEAAGSTVTSGVGNTGGFSINGQRPRGNNYMLDGTDNNEVWLTGEEQVFTIGDAVEEVSVQTGNFSVEFGRAGGGVFNVVTKSGTNDLHGTAFGLAWSPSGRTGWLGRLFGDGKTVWRGGYQVSYDTLFTQLDLALFSSRVDGFTLAVLSHCRTMERLDRRIDRATQGRDPERRLKPGVDGGLRPASWVSRFTI